MRIPTGNDYPASNVGDLAVCYFLTTATAWEFIRATDRADAEKEFDRVRRLPDVLVASVDGGSSNSAVVWIAECRGAEWARIKETRGATTYLDPDE